MACRHAYGDQEVAAFGLLWKDASSRNRIRLGWDLHISFVPGESLGGYIALRVVAIHVVSPHADTIVDDFDTFAVFLGHHVIGDQSPSFSHVELSGPIAVIEKLVFSKSVVLEYLSDRFGDSWVVGQRPHEALLVAFMVLEDLFTPSIVCVGVVVVLADVIGAKCEIVVHIGLPVGHPDRGPG